MAINHELDKDDLRAFESDAKVGLLATVNPRGLPHITFIATIQAKTPRQLIWGQFTEGLSKQHLKTDPHAAFLIMSLNKELWRGKAQWTHERKEGEEYELF
ncbi:MAG: pyridoxamine 5'-phosphate oxidase family protein [Firmicutes bacterium]|nr:pyridoxamine 5'-phosphate oxidase family protein [Bacillota bacterium]